MRKRSTEKSEEQYVSQQKSSFDKKETLVKILHCKFDICSLHITYIPKVRQSRKKIMTLSIVLKNERNSLS